MKKEDLTTRLLRNFFHIQGPFDECRQEVIYKACARSMIQIFYSSFILFLFYILFGSFIEIVRNVMPYIYFGLILFMSIKAQKTVQELHLEKDDKSEIIYKTYSKRQIKVRSGLVFISIEIGLFALLLFHKLFVQQMSLSTFLEKIIQTEIMIPLLVFGLSIGAIFGTMVYCFLSEHEVKHSESGMHKENIEK